MVQLGPLHQDLARLPTRCLKGLQTLSSESMAEEGSDPKLTHVVAGDTQLLQGH